MATIDECIEFALKNIGLWWRYGIGRHCDEWKYIIIGRIFESEIILIPPSLKISESSSNGSYRNTDELDESTESAEVATSVLTCNDPHSYFSGFFITVNMFDL